MSANNSTDTNIPLGIAKNLASGAASEVTTRLLIPAALPVAKGLLVAMGPVGWLALGGAVLFGAILASDDD